MSRVHLTPFSDLQSHFAAGYLFFAPQRSVDYALSQENSYPARELQLRSSKKGAR